MRQEVGSLIAAVSGVLLVQVPAGGLPAALEWPVRLLGILGFVGVLWYLWRRWRQPAPERRPRSRRAIRTFVVCLGLIVVGLLLGLWLFTQVLPTPALIVPWIVILLGLHFLLFATTFEFPIFERLGGVLFVLGIVGGAIFLSFTPAASALTGIVAGFVLLIFSVASEEPQLGPVGSSRGDAS
ncbi:MAG TPA: hypothetical protein VKA58_06910 [Propionibacteriaceae bacterium]|jgi:hypothetical protein|nr:hypothetical protein [Propionibacteriaceae bacterium]